MYIKHVFRFEKKLQISHDYTSEATTEKDSETMISFALGDRKLYLYIFILLFQNFDTKSFLKADGGDEIISKYCLKGTFFKTISNSNITHS